MELFCSYWVLYTQLALCRSTECYYKDRFVGDMGIKRRPKLLGMVLSYYSSCGNGRRVGSDIDCKSCLDPLSLDPPRI